MAKCPICISKKGKRKCLALGSLICSQCCGEKRTEDSCSECAHYQVPKRKYTEVPAYSTSNMAGSAELEAYGNSIEGALCAYDFECGQNLRDSDAIKIIEMLIDKYHFQDQTVDDKDEIIMNGYNYVDKIIGKDLENVETAKIVKVLGVIRFVARRRTNTGREYMDVIHQYVGHRVGTGIRAMPQWTAS